MSVVGIPRRWIRPHFSCARNIMAFAKWKNFRATTNFILNPNYSPESCHYIEHNRSELWGLKKVEDLSGGDGHPIHCLATNPRGA